MVFPFTFFSFEWDGVVCDVCILCNLKRNPCSKLCLGEVSRGDSNPFHCITNKIHMVATDKLSLCQLPMSVWGWEREHLPYVIQKWETHKTNIVLYVNYISIKFFKGLFNRDMIYLTIYYISSPNHSSSCPIRKNLAGKSIILLM